MHLEEDLKVNSLLYNRIKLEVHKRNFSPNAIFGLKKELNPFCVRVCLSKFLVINTNLLVLLLTGRQIID